MILRVSILLTLSLILACDDPDEFIDDDEAAEIEPRVYAEWTMVNRGYAVSALNGKVNMQPASPGKNSQKWVINAGAFGDMNLKAYGTTLCLNAHNPGQGSVVNLYSCNTSDKEQQWYGWYKNVRLYGTSLCLNAYKVSTGSGLTLWPCSTTDPDQQFTVTTTVPNGGA